MQPCIYKLKNQILRLTSKMMWKRATKYHNMEEVDTTWMQYFYFAESYSEHNQTSETATFESS